MDSRKRRRVDVLSKKTPNLRQLEIPVLQLLEVQRKLFYLAVERSTDDTLQRSHKVPVLQITQKIMKVP